MFNIELSNAIFCLWNIILWYKKSSQREKIPFWHCIYSQKNLYTWLHFIKHISVGHQHFANTLKYEDRHLVNKTDLTGGCIQYLDRYAQFRYVKHKPRHNHPIHLMTIYLKIGTKIYHSHIQTCNTNVTACENIFKAWLILRFGSCSVCNKHIRDIGGNLWKFQDTYVTCLYFERCEGFSSCLSTWQYFSLYVLLSWNCIPSDSLANIDHT